MRAAYRVTDICLKCRLRQASGKIKEEFQKFRIVIQGVFIIMHAQILLDFYCKSVLLPGLKKSLMANKEILLG